MSENANMKSLIVIAETNFILDIVFQQSAQADRLLTLVLEREIPIVAPEYSFAEARGNLVHTMETRVETTESMIRVLRQSDRSAYQQNLDDLMTTLEQFRESSITVEMENSQARIDSLKEQMVQIPFNNEIATRAELRELNRYPPEKPTDKRVYESILMFARENPGIQMLFLTSDRTDFDLDFIRNELAENGIEIFFSAGDCIRRIREILGV
jgi:hypothetical protein